MCCTGCMAKKSFVEDLLQEGYTFDKCDPKVWDTSNGKFTTVNEINIDQAMLPNLTTKQTFRLSVSINSENNGSYDIIKKDMIKYLRMNIDVVANTIHWDELLVPMVNQGHWTKMHIEAYCFRHF